MAWITMGWKSIGWLSIWLMILHLFNICTIILGLKDLKIYVPEAVATGDAVTLSCYYNLENASLYSVRWYLEQEEFYRFVPKESPPSRQFAVNGISVDLTKSGEHAVTLRSVPRIISGKFQCEVSADAPLFHTETSTATMLVAELPAHKPLLTVYSMPNNSKNVISIGELLKASCVSGPSYPPVNFTWIINGNIFPSSNVGLRPVQSTANQIMPVNATNEKEAWSDLIVRVDSHMITPNSRKMLVRCETNIFNLYRGAAEAELKVNEENFWLHGGKVSPTTDQRSSGTSTKNGDPDNSALQSNSAYLLGYRLNSILVFEAILLAAAKYRS